MRTQWLVLTALLGVFVASAGADIEPGTSAGAYIDSEASLVFALPDDTAYCEVQWFAYDAQGSPIPVTQPIMYYSTPIPIVPVVFTSAGDARFQAVVRAYTRDGDLADRRRISIVRAGKVLSLKD